jgi:hypothetical protein
MLAIGLLRTDRHARHGTHCRNRRIALKLAQAPEKIPGYGHAKKANTEKARVETEQLMSEFKRPAKLIVLQRGASK